MDPELLLKQLGVDLVKDADDLETLDEGTDKFKIYSRTHDGSGTILKASVAKDEDGEEEWLLNGIASSTIKDRHGDVMLPSALVDMERSANDGLTMFLNHKYEVPEDVAGTVKSAKIVSFGNEAETGAPIYDLDYAFRVNKRNERAKNSFLAIQDKTKLGLSIGARIPEGGAIRNKKTGKLLIAHVDLLETSIVGVPANPRSWVERSVEAVKEAVEKRKVFALGELKVASIDVPLEPVADPEPTAPEETAKAADPETPEPTEDVITQSTTPSQDAPESTPGDDGIASTDVTAAAETPGDLPDLAKAGGVELIDALVKAQGALSDTTLQLIQARQELQAAEQRAVSAERQRDIAVQVAKDLTADTAQIIQRLGSLPVGQKASFRRIATDFSDGLESAADVLGDEFLATLRSFQK